MDHSIPAGRRLPSTPPTIGLAGIVWPAARPDGSTKPSPWRLLDPAPARPLPGYEATAGRAALAAPDAERELPIEFTARGSDYFRVWIVNLLLTVVTLGLYYPWAKARTLRYFYGNTRIDGHPLDFHGQPRRMLRGLLLVGGLFFAYSLASEVSGEVGLLALVIVASIWPALLQAGWAFRVGQTSWRGLRFEFTGEVRGAYEALRPALILGLAVAVLPLAASLCAESMPRLSLTLEVVFVLCLIGFVLLLPYYYWRMKGYIHNGFRYGSLFSRFEVEPTAMYGLVLRALGLLLLLLAAGAAAFVIVGVSTGLLRWGATTAAGPILFAAAVAGAVGYAVVLLVMRPYLTARLQNLLWSGTRARSLRIESDLAARELIGLSLRNGVLIVLTLGLFWPFAVVDTVRLRLAGVRLHSRLDFDTLVDRQRERALDAAGDAAADLAGFDIGL